VRSQFRSKCCHKAAIPILLLEEIRAPQWFAHNPIQLPRFNAAAKVAMARRLAICLYWMWRKGWDYEYVKKFGSHAGQPGNGDGVQ
jgi:hypothetical protein